MPAKQTSKTTRLPLPVPAQRRRFRRRLLTWHLPRGPDLPRRRAVRARQERTQHSPRVMHHLGAVIITLDDGGLVWIFNRAGLGLAGVPLVEGDRQGRLLLMPKPYRYPPQNRRRD